MRLPIVAAAATILATLTVSPQPATAATQSGATRHVELGSADRHYHRHYRHHRTKRSAVWYSPWQSWWGQPTSNAAASRYIYRQSTRSVRRAPVVAEAACPGSRIVATWYQSGRRTASGAAFNPNGLTAAHRTLPFGSRVTVTNPRTGRSVTVTINDRGPFTRGVTLDLARGAAQSIGMHSTQPVCMASA